MKKKSDLLHHFLVTHRIFILQPVEKTKFRCCRHLKTVTTELTFCALREGLRIFASQKRVAFDPNVLLHFPRAFPFHVYKFKAFEAIRCVLAFGS